MTDLRPGVAELSAQIGWTDTDVAATAREHAVPAWGRLAELGEWLAATQAHWPPHDPAHPRLAVLGPVTGPVAAIADAVGAGVREIALPEDGRDALTAGAHAADAEVDAGADLLVFATPDTSGGGADTGVVVGLLTGAEPVALLPRGADAVDTPGWIARAEYLRDARRRVAPLRSQPDELLAGIASIALSVAVGFVLRAVARRTPVVLDGLPAVGAALLVQDIDARAAPWWQVADTSPDPTHVRALEELDRRPLLELGTRGGDGTAGLLSIPLLRAAAALTEEAGHE